MANQINQCAPISATMIPSKLEVAIGDQMNVMLDLESAIRRLEEHTSFVLIPDSALTSGAVGQSLQPVAPAASPAVDAIRNHTANLRTMADKVEALAQRF